MPRYGNEHKQETRQRIIESAGRRFKQSGIDGSGIATLMSDADLTNGAFYGHFASKEDLVATAIAEELRGQRANLLALEPGWAGVEQFVRAYLSVEHRDDPGAGCPSAALLDEVGRCSGAIRQAYTDGLMRIMDDIAVHLTPDDPRSARVTMFGIFAVMVGTLQMSRAIANQQLADAVLEQGVANSLALLDAARESQRSQGATPMASE